MQHLEIRPAVPEQSGGLAAMAAEIWREHYTPIIGAEQVAYMLEKFQSERAFAEQMERGETRYYIFLWDGEQAGYMGISSDSDSLFLSKLYVKKEYRGRKISRAALEFLEGVCREEKLAKIWLTVNRFNAPSIAAYRALGFSAVREQKSDIGGGYFMDDYIMERQAEPASAF